MPKQKVIVIGANHAGTACINALSQNKENEVVVYDKNNNISFLGCGMALWIGKQIKGSDGLFYSSKETLEKNGAKVFMQSEVTSIDFKNKEIEVVLSDNSIKHEKYDKLVLATGSTPVTLNVPGLELENIQYVKLFQNAQDVIDKIKTNKFKSVAVLGAGYIGVELAEAFERLGLKVTLIDIMPSVLSTHFDKEFSNLIKERMGKHNIKMALEEKVVEFKGENGKVSSVVTTKSEYKVDMVISCVGFRPNTKLGDLEIEKFKNGAYLVNKKQETSIKDVYAIGDCATVYDNSISQTSYIALATNAVRSGLIAASNINNKILESPGVQGSSGICIYDLKMVSTGISEERAKKLNIDVLTTEFNDLQKPEFMETFNAPVKIKIIYKKEDGTIIGCQIASEYDMSSAIHMFSLAIQEKLTIDKIKLLDIFFMPHFNSPYNYITMAMLGAK